MPITVRSQQVKELLPALRAGIRAARLHPTYADDALQQSLIALIPHLERLSAMTERERWAYAFVVASRTAMGLRKRVGIDLARGTDLEVDAWDRRIASDIRTPEQLVAVAESAERAGRAIGALDTMDGRIVATVAEDGLSEREAAQALGMSRGNLAFRLRRARNALGRAWAGTTSWARNKKAP